LNEAEKFQRAKRVTDALRDLQLVVGKMIASVPIDASISKNACVGGKIVCGVCGVSEQMIRDVAEVLHPYIPEITVDFGESPCGEHRKSITCQWREKAGK